jgi:hypothetical protein
MDAVHRDELTTVSIVVTHAIAIIIQQTQLLVYALGVPAVFCHHGSRLPVARTLTFPGGAR